MKLILGGVKSGKSSFASRLATEREGLGSVVYLATATAGDEEMKDRIRRHQADRPDAWITVEEPRKPENYFERLVSEPPENEAPGTVLFDCVTLWLTNLLAPMGDSPDREEAFALGEREATHLLESVQRWEGSAAEGSRETIFVSNLVETGLISPWPLGRIFQDLAGLTHQLLASAADEIFLMTAGLPQKLK